MDGLAGSELAGVLRVVAQLDDMNREINRLVRDLRRLEGSVVTLPLSSVATDMQVTTADLDKSLSGSTSRIKVGSYLAVIRQQSNEIADAIDAIASELPAAQRLIGAQHERLLAIMNELSTDLFPHRALSEEAPFPDEMLLLSKSEPSSEIHEVRIRALLAKHESVLIVDGDQVAVQGWPDLSVLNRRDSLLALLSTMEYRADIEVVFDCREAGRKATAVADGIQVLVTNPGTVPSDAVLFLVEAQPLGTPIMIVTDDRELVVLAQSRRTVLSASSVALLRLLVDA